MIGKALADYLKTITTIQDALSQTPHGAAIFPGKAPQGAALPYVLISVTGGTPDYHLTGEIGDLAKRVTVDVYAATRKEANDISELIRLAPLSGYDGGTWGDDEVVVKACLITSDAVEIDQPPIDGSDKWICRTITEYRITFERTVS